MPSLRRMTSNIAAQIAAVAASIIDRILLVGILLRLWGPDLFSDFAVVQSVAAFVGVAELGMQLYFINVKQAAFVNGDREAFRRLEAIHLGVILVIAAPLFAGLALFGVFGSMERLVNLTRIGEPEARAVFLMLCAGGLLAMIRSAATTLYIAAGDFTYSVLLGAMVALITTCASVAAAFFGAGPLELAAVYLAVSGIGALIYTRRDTRRRYPGFTAPPALPTAVELSDGAKHVKWFALQMVAPALWLQLPILILNAWKVGGHELTSFILIRTIANQVRLVFQFAAVGSGIEIAADAHRGDFARAWRLSARIGILTAVLSASAFAGVICFGDALTLLWTGDASLFDPVLAFYMLLPLVLIAPLQQPVSMLQFANMTLAPGLQRLLQIALGPALCIAGQYAWGTKGLVIGLAAAEIIAYWSVIPLLARIPFFTGLARYCAVSLAAAAAALAWGVLAGRAVLWASPAMTLPAMTVKAAVWTLVAVLPPALMCLPPPLRARLLERCAAIIRALSARLHPGK